MGHLSASIVEKAKYCGSLKKVCVVMVVSIIHYTRLFHFNIVVSEAAVKVPQENKDALM